VVIFYAPPVITSKAAAVIWRGLEAAFVHLRQSGHDANLLTALAAEEVPEQITAAFRLTYWDAHDTFFKLPSGRWFLEEDRLAAEAVLADLNACSPTEGGQELLRRFANAARNEYVRLAGSLAGTHGAQMLYCAAAGAPVDHAMAASGYKWKDGEYVKESTTTVSEVLPVPGVVALVQQAGFDQRAEELIIQMLELADEGLASNDLQGWTTATTKARDALAEVVAGVSAKVGLQTRNQADARKQLTKAGVITPEQETRLQYIYKAVCETAHKITSRPDAVLDVAVCLVAAEFVLRRLLERPRP